MDIITRLNIVDLITSDSRPCVSIFLPTGPGGTSMQADQIQLKNLITQADTQLEQRRMRGAASRAILAPARELLTKTTFWRNAGRGLALFAAPNMFHAWQVPVPLAPLTWVGSRCYLKPLLSLVESDTEFLLLAVSENRVRFFGGDRWRLQEVTVSALPRSLDEALNYRHPEPLLHAHSGQSAFRGKEGVVFHGQGGAPDQEADNLVAYLRAINGALRLQLRDERRPLVFAGVARLHSIFRQTCHYPHLLSEGIVGNPDYSSPTELHDQAAAVLEEYWQRDRRQDAARITELAGTERVSGSIQEILQGAQHRQLEALFVAADAQLWGRFTPDSGQVALATAGEFGAEDLLDTAAHEAWRGGARVHVAPSRDVPRGLLAAALFRYPRTDRLAAGVDADAAAHG